MSSSEIKNFFQDQTIFLTGGTGFLGHLLLEKLLRVCYDLKIIYVLVRDKKGKTAEERFDNIYNSVLFETLKKERPEFKKKIKLIKGNCSELGLGLSEDDRNLLKKQVNVVLHSAANVRFDQTLRNAAYSNVRAVMEILDLAKKITNLKAFVHVSTAFSNCHQTHVKEQFYEPPMQAEKLLNLLSTMEDDVLDRITPILMGKWLNTYIFTKCIGEDLIKRESGNLPICIIRPAIVMSTAEDPMPGWLHSLFGFGGVTQAIAVGALRTINLKKDAQLPVVPCDYVANTVLAAAWTTNKNQKEKNKEKRIANIYNFAGSNKNLFLWSDYIYVLKQLHWRMCSDYVIWYPQVLILENVWSFRISCFFLHTVPCYVADFVLKCLGKSPFVVKIYKKLDGVLRATEYFRMTSWKFDQENLEEMWKEMNETDQKLFNFNMENLVLKNYSISGFLFARQHLLNDPPETQSRAQRKVIWLFFLHYGIILLFLYLFVKVFCQIFSW